MSLVTVAIPGHPVLEPIHSMRDARCLGLERAKAALNQNDPLG
jgi:hypothetical protein